MTEINKFHEFKKTNKIWAIGSLHSNLRSFKSIKNYIFSNFSEGDKLIFLGNVIGFRNKSKEIISEVLKLRLNLMAKFLLNHDDIIFVNASSASGAGYFSNVSKTK